ncbi:MAG: EpsI family ATP-binding protein, partial [Chthoniobacterales bacterium]
MSDPNKPTEPKKETVRIVLPPRRDGIPTAANPREAAMVNLPPKPLPTATGAPPTMPAPPKPFSAPAPAAPLPPKPVAVAAPIAAPKPPMPAAAVPKPPVPAAPAAP